MKNLSRILFGLVTVTLSGCMWSCVDYEENLGYDENPPVQTHAMFSQ